jgi:hypothetical protein
MRSAAHDEVLVKVHSYVTSGLGQAKIQQALQRRRLPGAFDTEIEEAVIAEAMRFLANGGEITSAPGWCNARITARSIDLARGLIRREAREALEAPNDDITDVAAPDAGLSGLREAVLIADAHALDVCGALTFISVIGDGASLASSCPQPLAGATPQDAACWAGLWYANRDDCFGEGNTVTQRRSRAAKRIRALLAKTALSVQGQPRQGVEQ